MPRLPLAPALCLASALLPLSAFTPTALAQSGLTQSAGFADPGAIDAAVAAFTGAAIGSPGGARSSVDRRLRLAACTALLALAFHGAGEGMVRVECPGATPWRIFVPLAAGAEGAAAQPARAAPQVARGQVLTIVLQGRGFSVSQQGEALETGRVGDWIRVRPEGTREEVRARLDTPARAVIPLG